jgi:hypothetical protein
MYPGPGGKKYHYCSDCARREKTYELPNPCRNCPEGAKLSAHYKDESGKLNQLCTTHARAAGTKLEAVAPCADALLCIAQSQEQARSNDAARLVGATINDRTALEARPGSRAAAAAAGVRIGEVVLTPVVKPGQQHVTSEMIGAAVLVEPDQLFGSGQKTVSGLSEKQVDAIFARLAPGEVAVLLMATHGLFVINLAGECRLLKEVGPASARGNFGSKLAMDLSGCAIFAGGDPRGSGFETGAAAKGGSMEKSGIFCEPWCSNLDGPRHVEHTFSCSNMRHLFLETCARQQSLQLGDALEIYVRMRDALAGDGNLRVTPGDINQALVPVQRWSMGARAPRWEAPFCMPWGSVHMAVLAPLKQWAIPYVLGGMDRMSSVLKGSSAKGAVRDALHCAAGMVAARAEQVRARMIE